MDAAGGRGVAARRAPRSASPWCVFGETLKSQAVRYLFTCAFIFRRINPAFSGPFSEKR
jgi:hypothetical protein